MPSKDLNTKFLNYLNILRKKFKKNRLPATAIGAEFMSIKKTAFSGAPPDINSISPKLKKQLDKIGGVGHKIKGRNTVGCCCEVRSANKILGRRIKLQPMCITFTKAIRPRTGQVIARCQNCIDVFGNE